MKIDVFFTRAMTFLALDSHDDISFAEFLGVFLWWRRLFEIGIMTLETARRHYAVEHYLMWSEAGTA